MSAFITIRGRLGHDAQTRPLNNNGQIATGSLAVTLPSRQEDETEWFNLIAFGRVAETLAGYKKGDDVDPGTIAKHLRDMRQNYFMTPNNNAQVKASLC